MAAVWWQPCPGGARVLRVVGDSPCPVLPDAVDGVPVTELGPYCFAERAPALPAGARRWGEAHPHAVAGLFVEEVTLPDSVTTLHSAVFYDCRRLRRLTAGPNLSALGSDLFTNCRALQTLVLHAAPGDATGLRRVLVAVSADLTVEFRPHGGIEARLLYPEYWEVLDENMPAHLFNRGIEGEGYRYRQCFAGNGAVDFAGYDAAFARAAIGEVPTKLCALAFGRLLWPFALSAAAKAAYESYLAAHPEAALAAAVTARDAAALRLLGGLGLSPAAAAAACARAGWSEGAAALQGAFKVKKRYDFDDL